jgi:tRNA modification GTPase
MDTIVALSSGAGRCGVAVVRLSGPSSGRILKEISGLLPVPRVATVAEFLGEDGLLLDQGLSLFFPAPRSFTGEDIAELHCHGSPVVVELVIEQALRLGARMARPGEFAERAFLNGKMDLSQAEAVADLIDSGTRLSARAAARTMQGALSDGVKALRGLVLAIRAAIEAQLDFSGEDVEIGDVESMERAFRNVIQAHEDFLAKCKQGQLLRDGVKVVIAGPVNVGKSSLFNALSGSEMAIVTDIAGTTRDVLREWIDIDGLTVEVVDTAGLRDSTDDVEREGVRRARAEIANADILLWVIEDWMTLESSHQEDGDEWPPIPVVVVRNKIDVNGARPGLVGSSCSPTEVRISTITGAGLEALRKHLKETAGYNGPDDILFTARRRHMDAMEGSLACLRRALRGFQVGAELELIAEEMRLAQGVLGEILGGVTSEELLEEVFGRFCIGK